MQSTLALCTPKFLKNFRLCRSKKRRMGDELEDEHHGDFDPNELRQHEEFTKVKNVDKIELGRYELETWYFSPLPPEYNNCKVRPAS